jgi:hypothetical protein
MYRVKRQLTLKSNFLYDSLTNPNVNGTPVSPGTLVRLSQLRLDNHGPFNGIVPSVRGRIADGPLTDRPVDLIYISQGLHIEPRVPRVATNILELVGQP